MFIQITKEELSKDILKKAWYQATNIIWTIIFLYPLFSIVDFIYAPDIWLQFFIVRIITVLIIYALFTLFRYRNYNYRVLLHITFLFLSVTSAILCTTVTMDVLNIYFLLYSTIILFFNLQAFWEPLNSVIETLMAFCLLGIFFNQYSNYNLDQFISTGGQFFFITAVVSCLIPTARYKIIERDIRSQILIEKSNEQLKDQNRDINEKSSLIDRQYEQLRKLDEQKNSFIHVAGHDLKNLIGSIVMSNSMLMDEEYRLSADQREFSGYIKESSEKMQYMLNKLMDVKEIESPEMSFSMEVFDINAEVVHVYKGLVETAQMKNIGLVDNILKLPIHLRLDRVFVGQVFQNLLSNAIKLSQTNNSIKVTTRQELQQFVFEIIDDGIAIGQEELDMMFNKLKTLNDAAGSTESRLGLGLSIAKLMTQELGGTLTYRSDDNGNYFKVEFQVIN